MMTAVELTE